MEEADSSKTFESIYQITWHHITEDSNLHSHHNEDLNSHKRAILGLHQFHSLQHSEASGVNAMSLVQM
jgi:hypothetical protein